MILERSDTLSLLRAHLHGGRSPLSNHFTSVRCALSEGQGFAFAIHQKGFALFGFTHKDTSFLDLDQLSVGLTSFALDALSEGHFMQTNLRSWIALLRRGRKQYFILPISILQILLLRKELLQNVNLSLQYKNYISCWW